MRTESTKTETDFQAGSTFEARETLVLTFNEAHQVLLRRIGGSGGAWTVHDSYDVAKSSAGEAPASVTEEDELPVFGFEMESAGGSPVSVFFALAANGEQSAGEPGEGIRFFSIEEIRRGLAEHPADFSPQLHAVINQIGPHVVRIPYLKKKEHDYIYRFRPEKQRNRSVYHIDADSERLYQSTLCQAIKEVKRINERSSTSPAVLDFGAVSYVLPSHFGFCLGVQNAIERAYESLAENPDRPVYMLSELIHNPFVNDDLRARGLRYLQSDKGEPLRDDATGDFLWDKLEKNDVVVIPAFGATDKDKARLVEKGIAINRYDATCMLVEKVWKAAQRFGREGYTVIIHGKAEHEETKATFSNAAKTGPAITIRNMVEAEQLAAVIQAEDPQEKRERFEAFAEQHTPGFDPVRDLDRVAVVNQTTLLRNETLRIIAYFEDVLAQKFGRENLQHHLNSNSKGDTLCYATQVNQDALKNALAGDLDLAVVAGGKNSSNTYQLFRLCQERLGERAFYIQSERNILSAERVLHYSYDPRVPLRRAAGDTEERPFLPEATHPLRILLTGGASCPDGVIQQIITRINSFFPREEIRPVSRVLEDFRE